jgi:LacI family transcriptional regulator
MSLTIKEIADICGVSHGTVDRALNNRPGISEKTKSKILKVAKELNFKPDFLARSLAKGSTKTIGVVIFDLYNRAFSQLTSAIEIESRRHQYFVNLLLTEKDIQTERKVIEHLVDRKVDGIILFPINFGSEFESYLESLRIPVVTVCNKLSGDWSYIGIDDRSAMRDAVVHVVSKGYERVVYICPPLAYRGITNIYTQDERLQGLLEGLQQSRIIPMPTIITDKDYIEALSQIDLNDARTAIMCSCDLYALEVMNYVKKQGLQIPSDIGIMGFDNIDVLQYVTPRLTTVHYDVEQMGTSAVAELMKQLNERGSFSSPPLLQYNIIEGESL